MERLEPYWAHMYVTICVLFALLAVVARHDYLKANLWLFEALAFVLFWETGGRRTAERMTGVRFK
jgi:hypothetical protein